MQKDIEEEYYTWLCNIVSGTHYSENSYTKLLNHLNSTDFSYTIKMDGNREADGIDLRYRFGQSHGYSNATIHNTLDTYACSVLEMMVALSIRCEESIMSDSRYDDRTSVWFWIMLDNLGISGLDDDKYNFAYVEDAIDYMLNREYDHDGHGALFTIQNCRYDLRTADIWYQMLWYLNVYLQK